MVTTRKKYRTPEYNAWNDAIRRCSNPRVKYYSAYGGRGITVCAAWRKSFATFLADMGPRPGAGYSLDRINNDGNYEPGNCRWATFEQQIANRRKPSRDYAGATYIKRTRRWVAQIGFNSKNHYLGSFATKDEAAAAYRKAVIENGLV